jgi:PEP-CTERM motif
MKRFLWFTPILFVLMSSSLFADSVTTFIGLLPNDGSGDNFGFFQQGNGVTIGIAGGVPYDFFNIDGYAPGSTLGGSADVFFSEAFIQIGSNSYDLDFNGPGTLFLSGFTLPTNGKDFTAHVELEFSASATIPDLGQTLDVSGGRAGKMTFHFFNGFYYADSAGFTVVPEPNTLGFMATGLAGIIGVIRRKRNCRSVVTR